MNMLINANWIKPITDMGNVCPIFRRKFSLNQSVVSVKLYISSLGVYEAAMNQKRIGDFIFAPGWTSYNKRLQYQVYDITKLIEDRNELTVLVGNGWCVGRLGWENRKNHWSDTTALIASLEITYTDNSKEYINTDAEWQSAPSRLQLSEIYDGEVYDARIIVNNFENAAIIQHSKNILIPQEGEVVKEIENLNAKSLIITPKGETVIDFGQNITGYVEFRISGQPGDTVEIYHAEVLDSSGNFYIENLRSAKQKITYICGGAKESYKPHFSFQGFRYIRLHNWPSKIELDDFHAIVVHSDIKRTGYFECSNNLVNRLFGNIIWSQKGNFIDVPIDCPQRDERLGWTGDAQVFIRAASYNFNINQFFTKWLHDLAADQFADGGVPHVIPFLKTNTLGTEGNSAAWGDAAIICPWQLYLTYGNVSILEEQYDSMTKWISYVESVCNNGFIWNNGKHFGDWLGLDSAAGSFTGATKHELIATAFFAYSTSILIKVCRILKKDSEKYVELHNNIVKAFTLEFIRNGRLTIDTQTAHVLALYFNLVENRREIADHLVELIKINGNRLSTGFLGTPYLLHVLSENGCSDMAYTLLLQEDYPSWLYSVKMGATTVWEHMDGIKPDGKMWSTIMNSFNHYAYGSVADWMYSGMAGINTDEISPGFEHIIFKPVTDKRLDYVKASIETKYGLVSSSWICREGITDYDFIVPMKSSATIIIDEKTFNVGAGEHHYTF